VGWGMLVGGSERGDGGTYVAGEGLGVAESG